MNKKSLLLALLTASTPLIAAEKPSQVLESLMQPLPSVEANIQARAAVYPALRQIPSSACAFVSMADVQGNITKLLNTKLLMHASKGESAKSIAAIPPIENIAIALEQGAELNMIALIKLQNNFTAQLQRLQLLSNWEKASKEEYQASFKSIIKTLEASEIGDIFEGVNKNDINLPEMRISATMKPGSDALIEKLNQKFDEIIEKQGLPIPSFKQDGYTIITLPLAMAVAMIPNLPAGSLDAIIKSQHYLAVKFEGNCISVIYSRDLKKINAPSSIEQSMLASDKLKHSDSRLKQGIVSSSFINAELINMMANSNSYSHYTALLQNVFQSFAKKHTAQAPTFEAASLASEQISKQIKELRKNSTTQFPQGNYSDVLWSSDKLNYEATIDVPKNIEYYKPGKVYAWSQIDKAETITYLSMSPVCSIAYMSLNFDSKAFIANAMQIGKAFSLTLNKESKFNSMSDKGKVASQALCNIYKGSEGSVTLYADNMGNASDLCKSSCATEIFREGKAPRLAIFRAVKDPVKLNAGMEALQGLCTKGFKLKDKYSINDKFVSFGNSSSLNQSLLGSLSQTAMRVYSSPTSEPKEFAGFIFYFNAKAIAPLLPKEKNESIQVMPEVFYVASYKDGKILLRITLK